MGDLQIIERDRAGNCMRHSFEEFDHQPNEKAAQQYEQPRYEAGRPIGSVGAVAVVHTVTLHRSDRLILFDT